MISFESIGLLIGGIGLFLLGMDLMTDGLRLAAGDALVNGMRSLTGNPFQGILSGAFATAIVQSSSATTLMTIGMVSAGVLSFQQSVGVIFGANIGTTMTSWIVAVVGLKFKVSAFAYPFVGVGAMVRTLGKGRWRHFGAALAGFGLLFVGIDLLQGGMTDLASVINPESLNPESFLGRLGLVGVGLVMTVVMQSSSAAIASTLAALDSGAITFGAAAALVIGQNLGTTVTAVIGSVGANIPARRTAMAHIGFNVVAGLVAFAIFPVFENAVSQASVFPSLASSAVQIAAFHTAFNVLGLLILLPFFDPFCRAVERLVPGKPRKYTSGLDDSSLTVPAVAVVAVHAALFALLKGAAQMTQMGIKSAQDDQNFVMLEEELVRARQFLLSIVSEPSQQAAHQQHVDTLHAMDHIDRFVNIIVKPSFYAQARDFAADDPFRIAVSDALQILIDLHEADASEVAELRELSQGAARQRAQMRDHILDSAAHRGVTPPDELTERLRFIVRADRILYHSWRASQHLSGTDDESLHTTDDET